MPLASASAITIQLETEYRYPLYNIVIKNNIPGERTVHGLIVRDSDHSVSWKSSVLLFINAENYVKETLPRERCSNYKLGPNEYVSVIVDLTEILFGFPVTYRSTGQLLNFRLCIGWHCVLKSVIYNETLLFQRHEQMSTSFKFGNSFAVVL
ncbi:hypothetical protein GJ496_000877 [Pomphorhynchus laevis]|nr:hypothetical protein GJ496_000877 [Pomphorhynchus laevis]